MTEDLTRPQQNGADQANQNGGCAPYHAAKLAPDGRAGRNPSAVSAKATAPIAIGEEQRENSADGTAQDHVEDGAHAAETTETVEPAGKQGATGAIGSARDCSISGALTPMQEHGGKQSGAVG